MLPVQQSSFAPSVRDQMQSLLFNTLNRDETEGQYASMLLSQLATTSVENIGRANRSSTEGTVSAVQSLIAMGFDKDDAVVTELMASDAEIRQVYKKIAETIPSLLRSH